MHKEKCPIPLKPFSEIVETYVVFQTQKCLFLWIFQSIVITIQSESKKVWFAAPGAKLYIFWATLLYGVFSIFFENLLFFVLNFVKDWIKESQIIRKIVIRKFAIFSSGLIFQEKLFKFTCPNFFFAYSKVLNIHCSVETLRTIEKQFFRKNYTRTEIANFLITILQIFWDSVIQSF